MIGLDTNVLIRFVTGDDPVQTPIATDLMRQLTADNPGFIGREVLLEFVWTLERSYRYSRSEITDVILGLCEAKEIAFEAPERAEDVLRSYETGRSGFADQMVRLAALAGGCTEIVTFDAALGQSESVRLLR